MVRGADRRGKLVLELKRSAEEGSVTNTCGGYLCFFFAATDSKAACMAYGPQRAQLLVRGQDQIKQVLKASVDPGEPEM
jgi:hypothetical protein